MIRGPARSPLGFPSEVRLFRLFGIDFVANWTWALLLALLVVAAAELFASVLGPEHRPYAWPLALMAALLSVASLYGHELAHALVARSQGIQVRTVSLFLLGGVAHVVQESPSPRAELLIALAGPAMSLTIGIGGSALSALVGTSLPPLGALGLWLALTNVPLAIFNMVPAFPLDGGRVLRGLLWFAGQDLRWASAMTARFGQVAGGAILFAGLYGIFTGTSGIASGLWMVLLAWFLYAGAVGAHRATLFREILARITIGSVMQRNPGRVEAGTTLRSFAEEQVARDEQAHRAAYPRAYGVYRDDLLVGLLGIQDLRRVPSSQWGSVALERVMLPLERAPKLPPEASGMAALEVLLAEGVDQLAVVADGSLLGVLTRADLARAATTDQPR